MVILWDCEKNGAGSEKRNITVCAEQYNIFSSYTSLSNAVFIFSSALQSVADKENLLKEVSIMLSFSHPNVMSLTGVCIDGEMPLIIMPFMINGSVLEYVKQHREKLYLFDNENDIEVNQL